MTDRVYVKKSSIPTAGKGLFAKVAINRGQTIVEYTGKILKPNQKSKHPRSTIKFIDDYQLDCPDDDPASFANDPVKMPTERRKLIAALNSNEPFYKLHENARINAEIKNDDDNHRAFLVATQDIKQDDEIFCHYGFHYWFMNELQLGFLQEDEIDTNGFPQTFHQYPGFVSYVKLFYPDCTRISHYVCNDFSDVNVHTEGDVGIVITIPNYRKMITRMAI